MLLQAVCNLHYSSDHLLPACDPHHGGDDPCLSVINAWLQAGRVMSVDMARFQTALAQDRRLRDTPIEAIGNDWKRVDGFSMPRQIDTHGFHFGLDELCLIYRGLRPEVMEDKWFVYFDYTTLHCHHSWTGRKYFEAVVSSSDTHYVISELTVESDPEIWSLDDDDEAFSVFFYLVTVGLLGREPTAPPWEDASLVNTWCYFGRMAFPGGSDRVVRLNDAIVRLAKKQAEESAKATNEKNGNTPL
jgi:hypothetical protein